MKILFLTSNTKCIGGKERYDTDVMQALQECGEKVRSVKLTGKSWLKKVAFVFVACLKATFFRPDVLFSSHISFSPIVYVLHKVFRIPYVMFTAGVEVWDIKKHSLKKALRDARLVVSISHYTTEKLKNQIEELREKIFLLPPTVRENLFRIKEKPEYLARRHGLRGKEVLLTVARLRPNEEEKGYLKVIDTLPELRKEFPNIRYVIVGAVLKEFGDNRERVRAYAREKGVDENVIVVGEVSDKELADYYNLCDVFVMPSTQEGFGIVFLEALASGKPVIAGNKDGSRDALLDGKLGLLVDPRSVEEITEALRKVLKKEIRPELLNAEYLRKETLQAYGFDVFKRRVVELVHELETR